MDALELKRYNRQIILSELGIDGQHKLKAASVLVIGAGGLGCPVLLYLTAAGIGTIGIVDHDHVDETNLQRQILFNINDVGKNKVEAAVCKLKALNPYVNLMAYPIQINAQNAQSLIEHYDLILDGSDNFPTRYTVNDCCVSLGKPLVFGSIFKYEGQISVFNYKGGPDYRSVYPGQPAQNEVLNCGESGVIGTLPGIIGSYMANEAIKIIVGSGETLSGKLLVFNALYNSFTIFQLEKEQQPAPVSNRISIQNSDSYKEISPETFEKLNDTTLSYFLIDVREEYEFEDYNIGGINIPLYELKDQIESLPTDKNIIFCCATGTRSKIAANLLKNRISPQIFIMKLNI